MYTKVPTNNNESETLKMSEINTPGQCSDDAQNNGMQASAQAAGSASSVQDEIACLAYSYWELRGGQDGSPEEDWLRAEAVVLRQCGGDAHFAEHGDGSPFCELPRRS